MATLKLELDTRSSKEEKQIRIRINHNKTSSFLATKVCVREEDYTGDPLSPVSKGDMLSENKNAVVSDLINKCNRIILDLTMRGKVDIYSANEIRDMVVGLSVTRESSFIRLIDDYISACKKEGTAKTFRYTKDTLIAFCEYAKISTNETILRIDYRFLRDLDKWMTDERKFSPCTKSIVMRCLRAIYNEAIRCNLVSYNDYPFRSFHIKKAVPLSKEFISQEYIKKLLSLDLTTLQGEYSLDYARDIFLISFYLCGMNLIDIYTLEHTDGDTIVKVRSKEEHCGIDPVRIKITPELQCLIERHKGKKHLFNFAEKFKNYETFQRNVRDRISRLGKMTGSNVAFNFKNLRHTWATYASRLGVDKFVIDKSLGHADKTEDTTAFNYVIYDWGLTDEANKKVITYATSDVAPNSIPTKAFIRDYEKESQPEAV